MGPFLSVRDLIALTFLHAEIYIGGLTMLRLSAAENSSNSSGVTVSNLVYDTSRVKPCFRQPNSVRLLLNEPLPGSHLSDHGALLTIGTGRLTGSVCDLVRFTNVR